MKRKGGTLLALMGAAVLAAGGAAGCGENAAGSAAGKEGELSGSIQIVGSTSMQKLADAWAESFMEKHRGVTVNVEFVGSGAGIEAVANGRADIGNSSRSLKYEEEVRGVVENVVAVEGIAVCVDGTNAVSGLTLRQLADIYTGAVTNWKAVGGADAPVVVIGREAGSGTREAFEELLNLEEKCVYTNELDATGAVMARIASTPGAIGYVSIDVVDSTVRAIPLEGVEPTVENIRAGKYCLSRPFVMATKGCVAEQNELIRAWFEYVYSEEGQNIAARVGLITVK